MANSDGFDEFADRLDRLGKTFPSVWSEALELAATQLNGDIKDRIFNDSENVDGSSFGSYTSDAYLKKRAKEQNRYNKTVNLQFTGELFRSIGIAKRNKEASVIINSKPYKNSKADTVKVARYQDDRYGDTFYSSSDEADNAVNIISDRVNQWLNSAL